MSATDEITETTEEEVVAPRGRGRGGRGRPPRPRKVSTKTTSSPFGAMISAGTKGFLRDKTSLFFSFAFPLMFLLVFGLIFGDAGADKVKLGAVGDGQVISALESTGAVEYERYDSLDAALQAVKDGDIPAVVSMQGDQVQLRFAASDATQAGIVQGLVSGVTDKLNVAAAGGSPRFQLDSQQVEDSSLKPIQYLAPGIMSWAVAVSAVFGVALTLVSWRKKQVLRRIRLAPVTTSTVLSSRLLVAVGIAVLQAILFIGVGLLPFFGLQLTGTWYLAIPVFLCGVLAFFSIGMFVGSFAKTEEAAQGMSNMIVLPMAFVSGTFFPTDSMPDWLNAVSKVLPLRHMNDGMLDFLVRGKGPEAMLLPCAVLLGFTAVVGFLASRIFRWED